MTDDDKASMYSTGGPEPRVSLSGGWLHISRSAKRTVYATTTFLDVWRDARCGLCNAWHACIESNNRISRDIQAAYSCHQSDGKGCVVDQTVVSGNLTIEVMHATVATSLLNGLIPQSQNQDLKLVLHHSPNEG